MRRARLPQSSAWWTRSAGARALAFAFFLARCTLDTGTFIGKTCTSNEDCPTPYVCAQVLSDSRSCELLSGVDPINPGGTAAAFYCSTDGGRGVHDVVAASCTLNCHGADHSYLGVPTSFRLDLYQVPGSLGAEDEAQRMQIRSTQGTMPPLADGVPRPTADDIALITLWTTSGTQLATPGVSVGDDCSSMQMIVDAGSGTDGGALDAGTLDAGSSDGGDGGL